MQKYSFEKVYKMNNQKNYEHKVYDLIVTGNKIKKD